MKTFLPASFARFLALSLLWLGLALGASPLAAAQQWKAAPPAEPAALPPVPIEWMMVPGTWLRVYGDEAHAGLMVHVARHGSAALPVLAERLGVPIGGTIHVYLAGSEEEFRTLQPGPPPEWADATAWPRAGAVFLRTPGVRGPSDEPLERVLEHELAHVLLGRAFAPATPPRWLQEGVAQLLAGEIGPDVAQTLQSAAFSGGPIALEDLERGFPADARRAKLAYAESADFVAWLVDAHGSEALPALVRASAGGATMRQAVRASTGRFLEDAESDWRSGWASGTGLDLATLVSGDWLWGVGGVALVVAFVRRRRQFHRRLAEMEAEEAALDALLAAIRSGMDPHGSSVSPHVVEVVSPRT